VNLMVGADENFSVVDQGQDGDHRLEGDVG